MKKALSGSVGREPWESQQSFFSWEEKDFLPHGVGFAAPEEPFGDSDAEVCPMSAHTQGPREPLRNQNCISGRNTTNSWAARPLYADVASFHISWQQTGYWVTDNFPLCPGGHQCLCITNQKRTATEGTLGVKNGRGEYKTKKGGGAVVGVLKP